MILRRNATNGGVGCAMGCILFLMAVLVIVLVIAGWGVLITLAWNALLSPLLGWPTLEIFQGIAASILLSAVGSIFRSHK